MDHAIHLCHAKECLQIAIAHIITTETLITTTAKVAVMTIPHAEEVLAAASAAEVVVLVVHEVALLAVEAQEDDVKHRNI